MYRLTIFRELWVFESTNFLSVNHGWRYKITLINVTIWADQLAITDNLSNSTGRTIRSIRPKRNYNTLAKLDRRRVKKDNSLARTQK